MTVEYFLIYDLADGSERMRGSGPEGIVAMQNPPVGCRIVSLPRSALPDGEAPDAAAIGAALWEQVKANREALMTLGAPTPYGVFNSDSESRVNIMGAALAAELSPTDFVITWTKADNTTVELDANAMKTVALTVFAFVATVHGAARNLREAIDQATTVEQLLMIDVLAGWPSA